MEDLIRVVEFSLEVMVCNGDECESQIVVSGLQIVGVTIFFG